MSKPHNNKIVINTLAAITLIFTLHNVINKEKL